MSEWVIGLAARYEHAPHPVTGRTIDAGVATVIDAEDRSHAMEQAQTLFGAHWSTVEPIEHG